MVWPFIKLLPAKTNFRFVAFSKYAAILSIILSIGSVAMVLIPFEGPCGGLNCGVDFKGGTVLDMNRGGKPIDLGLLRDSLNDAEGLHDVQVQGDGGQNLEAMIRFETPEGGNPAQQVEEIKSHLSGQFEGAQFTRTEVVGPKVSGELLTGGVMALFFAILLMMVYIWFRFEWQFGVGAALGLLHDVVLTFGLFALFNLEFTLTAVAAILTIIGYSMNDTVVVCDRLRENLRKYKKMPLAEVIDLSLNETLSRTIMTGITAVGALIGLAVLGGEALFGFSIALIFGIIVGTYSSIYVAAPVILIWGVNRSDADAEIVDMGGFKGKR